MPKLSRRPDAAPVTLVQAPSAWEMSSDRLFRSLAMTAALAILVLMAYLLWEIGGRAAPAVEAYRLDFFIDTEWNVQRQEFGILPAIWGTMYSSLLGLAIGGFFGLTVAVFLTEGFLWPAFAAFFRTVIEMLAAIPSVVFGLWGIFVVIPTIRPAADWLNENLGWIPFFSTGFNGPGLLPASIVLAIMVLPTVAAVSQESLRAIPFGTREAAFAMGATRWEAILRVLLPTAASGIFSALVLGFGRALGETMALAMLIGHSSMISLSLFAPAETLASLLASHFPEAGAVEVPALMYAALTLLVITLLVNMAGNLLLAVARRNIQRGH